MYQVIFNEGVGFTEYTKEYKTIKELVKDKELIACDNIKLINKETKQDLTKYIK